jgi:hypothetical protein
MRSGLFRSRFFYFYETEGAATNYTNYTNYTNLHERGAEEIFDAVSSWKEAVGRRQSAVGKVSRRVRGDRKDRKGDLF